MVDWSSKKVGEWEDEVDELKNFNQMIGDYVVAKTKLTKTKLKKLWTRKDYWFNAEQALKMGFIDEVI